MASVKPRVCNIVLYSFDTSLTPLQHKAAFLAVKEHKLGKPVRELLHYTAVDTEAWCMHQLWTGLDSTNLLGRRADTAEDESKLTGCLLQVFVTI